MPAHLERMLSDWHKKSGVQHPPCASGRYNSKWKWKVFDRQGREVRLVRYYVSRPASYYILVLLCADRPAKFVACVGQYSKFGTFLVEWAGDNNEYKKDCCGIRVFGPASEDIKYHPEAWDNQPSDVTPTRNPRPRESSGQPVTPQDQETKSAEAQSIKSQDSSKPLEPWRATRSHQTSVPPSLPQQVSQTGRDSPSGSEYTDASSSSEEEESSGEDIPFTNEPAPKRRKVEPDPSFKRPSPYSEKSGPLGQPWISTVLFEIKSNNSEITRTVTVQGPNYTTVLFAKARRFYQLLDPAVTVSVLSCQMPHSTEQCYVFEEEDEVAHILRKVGGGPDHVEIVVRRVA